MKHSTKNGIQYEENGWHYISVKGKPRERGYTYGYFCAKAFKEIQRMLEFVVMEEMGKEWSFFVEAQKNEYCEQIKKDFPEFYEEMEGIAEGCIAGGTPTSVHEIAAWNNYYTLLDGWYPHFGMGEAGAVKGSREGGGQEGEGGAGGQGGGFIPGQMPSSASKGKEYAKNKGQSDRCSAFIAVGDYCKDGKIVMAHNSFCQFIDGQYYNVILDIAPEKGHRILMQTAACCVWSGTDFFVTSAGIMGTETTIGGFYNYEKNKPIAFRIRQTMQYGKTLDDYVSILLDGNSGDYANSWLFGDTKTNEIMVLELGLKYHDVKRSKNGYFFGCNVAFDPRIRNLECSDTGYCDVRRHQGARQVRLPDMIEANKGQIDVDVAKAIISDHYDVYLAKDNPCSRTICSHYDMDAREYMSDPSRPKPFQPRGAIDGSVIDSESAKKMSFHMRFGNSCGIPFIANEFCNQHRQWLHLLPYLKDRPQQPWTLFSSTYKYDSSYKYTKTYKQHSLKRISRGPNRMPNRVTRKMSRKAVS